MRTRGQLPGKRDFERYRIRSLGKGLAVLRTVAQAERPMSVADIAELSGLNTVSAYRLLMTLQAEGYLEQDSFTKRYKVTPKVLGFGFSYLNGLGFADRSAAFLRQLAEATTEATSMTVLDDTEIVYISRYVAQSVLSINLPVGSRLPACFTAMGYVLLAALSEQELARRLADVKFAAPTPYGPQTMTAFLDRIRAARRQGYVVNDQYLERGIRSAAAPVRGASGQVLAAINVSAPLTRMSMARLNSRVVPSLVRSAGAISVALGYMGTTSPSSSASAARTSVSRRPHR